MIFFILLAALVCTVKSAGFSQSTHVNLTQSALVACLETSGGYELKFYLDEGTDTVDLVYLVNNTDNTDTSIGIYDSRNGFPGAGTTADPYVITVSVIGNLSSLPLQFNASTWASSMAYFVGPDSVGINVVVKSSYRSPFFEHILFPDDVIYSAVCNFSQLSEFTVTSSQLAINGSLLEQVQTTAEAISFEVKIPVGTATSSVNLGDKIYLELTPTEPSYLEGIYVYNCSVCDQPDCSAIKITLIDVDGCSIGNIIEPFRRVSGKYPRTPEFVSFTFSQSNNVYFSCVVDFCYSSTDTRCANYCEYNVNKAGRKRREAGDIDRQSEEQAVSTSVRITFDDRTPTPVDTHAKKLAASAAETLKHSQMNTALLASVITLAALLLIGLMAAICVFMRLTSQRANEKC